MVLTAGPLEPVDPPMRMAAPNGSVTIAEAAKLNGKAGPCLVQGF